MALATLTTKGQITIPKEIRDSLNLHSGDKIDFTLQNNGLAIIKPIANKIDDVFCKLHKPSRKILSIEEMNNAIKDKIHSDHQ